jgi:hypothetical protein
MAQFNSTLHTISSVITRSHQQSASAAEGENEKFHRQMLFSGELF